MGFDSNNNTFMWFPFYYIFFLLCSVKLKKKKTWPFSIASAESRVHTIPQNYAVNTQIIHLFLNPSNDFFN